MDTFPSIQLGTNALSASAQYAQWATDLGVSTTATLQAMNGDNGNWTFALASACLVAGATNAEFSSEGMVGWSGASKLNQPVNTDFTRMYYAGNIQPDMLWAFRFDYDCKSVGVKLQKAAGITILGGTIASLSGSIPQTIDFAVRFSDVLATVPQVVLTVSAGTAAARVGAIRLAPSPYNFASTTASAGQTVSLSVVNQTVNASSFTDKRGVIYMGAQGRQPGPPNHKAMTVLRAWKNIYQGGAGTIQGTVTIENIPGARQVRLFDKRTGLVIGETWSSVTGHYEFNNIDPTREYFVVAHDHHRVYNAVVQDMLTP